MPARGTGQIGIDAALVRRLVDAQFPQWSGLAVQAVARSGWDNRTFHLGDQMTVRLPSAALYALQVEKEQLWLPKLAPSLPLAIPVPLAMGEPGEGYPWRWSVYRWLEGESADVAQVGDLSGFAVELGRFLAALQKIDTTGGQAPGPHNFHRGGPLATYDAETRQAIATLGGRIDGEAAMAVWEAAFAATWRGPPVWMHGDVSAGNLLVRDGRLGAVIDFGLCGVGDPACDLVIAWTLFEDGSRDAFRAALPLDETSWVRGRGWALWKALITLARMEEGAPDAPGVRQVIGNVLADR